MSNQSHDNPRNVQTPRPPHATPRHRWELETPTAQHTAPSDGCSPTGRFYSTADPRVGDIEYPATARSRRRGERDVVTPNDTIATTWDTACQRLGTTITPHCKQRWFSKQPHFLRLLVDCWRIPLRFQRGFQKRWREEICWTKYWFKSLFFSYQFHV